MAANTEIRRKRLGAYYTPEAAAHSLVRWAVRKPRDRLLDPSAGDGRFLSAHRRSVGVDQDPEAAAIARERAPWALVHEGDFFAWASRTQERFECVAGNPPFIRYQHFSGEIRKAALDLCQSLGAQFSALSSSWAPFLVASASLLKPGGRMAFVVPAEIGHAPYARPLIEFLVRNFSDVRLLAVREKLFPQLSEDAWLLFADGYGGNTSRILLASTNAFSYMPEPPHQGTFVYLDEWRRWNYRIRAFLLPEAVRDLYQEVREHRSTLRFGEVAQVGIGYVTGANDFFHLRPSQADGLGIDRRLLSPTVRNGRMLVGEQISAATVKDWIRADDQILLLRLSPDMNLPTAVRRYLDSPEGREARVTYKCRNRSPWYSVPDVVFPNAFLSYMSGERPTLVANSAGCTCTNSVHAVRLTGDTDLMTLQKLWKHSFTTLSCEIEGHPLGGGMLKLEPREAQRVLMANKARWRRDELQIIDDGVNTLRNWRKYGTAEAASAM